MTSWNSSQVDAALFCPGLLRDGGTLEEMPLDGCGGWEEGGRGRPGKVAEHSPRAGWENPSSRPPGKCLIFSQLPTLTVKGVRKMSLLILSLPLSLPSPGSSLLYTRWGGADLYPGQWGAEGGAYMSLYMGRKECPREDSDQRRLGLPEPLRLGTCSVSSNRWTEPFAWGYVDFCDCVLFFKLFFVLDWCIAD